MTGKNWYKKEIVDDVIKFDLFDKNFKFDVGKVWTLVLNMFKCQVFTLKETQVSHS